MIESAELQGLARLKRIIASQPQTLDELWLSQPGLWQQLAWEKPQLKLWLRCQTEIEIVVAEKSVPHFEIKTDSNNGRPDLGEEIAKILQGAGKPMPLAQLKNKFPAGWLATEPMIKAAINKHPNLALTGPLVKIR